MKKMSKALDFLKGIIVEVIKEGAKDLFSDDDSKVQSEVKDEKEKITEELSRLKEKVKTPSKIEEVESLPNAIVPISGRILKLTNNFYYCKNINTTTFCNSKDFTSQFYPLATNSPFTSFEKGKMLGVRGCSLSMPIDRRRIVYPIVTKTGVSFGYKQVDVGPSYTKDYWITELRAPKSESGVDYLGNPTAKAGLDLLPQCFEDLGLCDFDVAYNNGYSTTLDMLVYEPSSIVTTPSKTEGHESPSNDSRPWFNELPFSGSEFFTFKELLRGWNLKEAPSNVQINNMIKLVKDLLVPLRSQFGALRVTNGLRDPEKNKAVGGRVGSLHLSGRAVDLVPVTATMEEVYTWGKVNLKSKVRELLWEFPHANNEHIHIGGPILPGETPNIRIKS